MTVLKWLLLGAAAIVGAYVAIVFLFALYFALAAYLPLAFRRIRQLFGAGRNRAA